VARNPPTSAVNEQDQNPGISGEEVQRVAGRFDPCVAVDVPDDVDKQTRIRRIGSLNYP